MSYAKNINLHIISSVRGESTGDWWIPLTNGQWRGQYLHVVTS